MGIRHICVLELLKRWRWAEMNFPIDNGFSFEVIRDEVWPSDTNESRLSNKCNLLNIGLAYGCRTCQRYLPSIAWEAMAADNWMSLSKRIKLTACRCSGDGLLM
jgi:hypothetical protein